MAVIIGRRRLHLNNIRANISQHHRAIGPRQRTGEIEDFDIGERLHGKYISMVVEIAPATEIVLEF